MYGRFVPDDQAFSRHPELLCGDPRKKQHSGWSALEIRPQKVVTPMQQPWRVPSQ